jgi:hypothetical protein
MEQKIQQSLEENTDVDINIKTKPTVDIFLRDSIDYTFMTSLINFEHFKYLLSKLIMSPLWVFKTPVPVISVFPGMVDNLCPYLQHVFIFTNCSYPFIHAYLRPGVCVLVYIENSL